jgi:SAM-dependent methyltransferase
MERDRRAGPYADPLVYDILHAAGTAAEVDLLQDLARRYARTRSRRTVWLEPACGTGRYLLEAARRGLDAIGFDRDPDMVAFARRRLARWPRARVFAADMTRFAPRLGRRRIDFAFNLISTIRHLETDADVLAHLADMGRVLVPGGVYAVGMHVVEYGRDGPEEDVWEGRRGRVRARQVVQYLPPAGREARRRWERVLSHVTLETPRGVEYVHSEYRLRAYGARQWQALVRRSQLARLATVDAWGRPVRGPPPSYATESLGAPPTFTRRTRGGTPPAG